METKSKNISLKAILLSIAIGIWAIVLQNAGIIPTNQNVKVVNSVDVSGTVDVGEVDVNITKINGWRAYSTIKKKIMIDILNIHFNFLTFFSLIKKLVLYFSVFVIIPPCRNVFSIHPLSPAQMISD